MTDVSRIVNNKIRPVVLFENLPTRIFSGLVLLHALGPGKLTSLPIFNQFIALQKLQRMSLFP